MNKLKEMRTSKGISQAKLSELSGVNLRMIQKYEQGDRDLGKASAITVYNLAVALGCEFEDLIRSDQHE